jgi:CheY-like chemotaxis protein
MADSPRILVAEDNRVCGRMIEVMLKQLGYEVDVRSTGRAAVEACLSANYAAVLMDGFMPDLDGFEAAREIRRLERGRRTPIVALTAATREADRQRCFDSGMDESLAKPVSMELLAATLVRLTSAP